MKVWVVLLCLSSTVFASLKEDREQWNDFKSKHGKLYMNVQEEKLRFSIFQQNLRVIEAHNRQYEAGNTTYKKGVNHFADITKEEFVSMLKRSSNGRPNFESYPVYKQTAGLEVPEQIDWRQKGAVSKVKDQGECGSCWAFSVTGTLESFNYLRTKEMVTYSEQQLVDCSKVNSGCGGGDEWPTLQYVQQYGIENDTSYPYEATDGKCRYEETKVALKTRSYVRLESKNEKKLLDTVGTLGPISVALDASYLSFYSEGVYVDSYCLEDEQDLNHAVLAVGYGEDEKTGMEYWLIKNSWGSDWGEEGYFKIKRGVNMCGIATDSVYPVL